MGKITDYIFRHEYYQNVNATYDNIISKYTEAFNLWLKEQSLYKSDSYDFKVLVYENTSNIQDIARCISYAAMAIRKSRISVEWLYYDTYGKTSIPPLTLKEYRFIKKNSIRINDYLSRIEDYNDLMSTHNEAINRFLGSTNNHHSFDQILKILRSKETIKDLGALIKRAHTCKNKYPLVWTMLFNARPVYKLTDDELKSISPYSFSTNQSYIVTYNELIRTEKQAIHRYLGYQSTQHNLDEIKRIAKAKEEIIKIGKALRTARKCKEQCPSLWEMFSHGRSLQKIELNELYELDVVSFLQKANFVSIFNSNEVLCKLIMGCKDYDVLDFSKETLEKENYCIQRLNLEYPKSLNYEKTVQIEGDEAKRAILDSTKYGSEVKFAETFGISEFYNLRSQADSLKLNFDDIITKCKENYSAIKSFHFEQSGKRIVYIEDYISASTQGSPLYNYIESYRKQKELRDKAKRIASNYQLGFSCLFGQDINFDECDLAVIQNIISSEQRIASKNTDEIRKKHEEEERRQFTEKTNRLKACVHTWPTLAYYDFKYNYLFPYYPTTCDFDATEDEWANRRLVWNFKNSQGKTLPSEHQRALDNLVPRIVRELNSSFGQNLSQLTLVCIPAASKENNERRFKDFSDILTRQTNMYNAYSHIRVTCDATPKHLGGTGMPDLWFDESFFKGKFILLFDDVITRGNSMMRFKTKMESMGAIVIGGFSIGRTSHTRY